MYIAVSALQGKVIKKQIPFHLLKHSEQVKFSEQEN